MSSETKILARSPKRQNLIFKRKINKNKTPKIVSGMP